MQLMIRVKLHGWIFYCLAAGLGTTPLMVIATTTVTVKVTVVRPPCSINSGNPITVDFGNEVMTTRVDGNAYRQKVNYTLNCTSPLKNAMKLTISGSAASFNSDLLGTNQNGLGIQLQNSNAVPVPINSTVRFNYPNIPILFAVPVKKTGVTLGGGMFSASATMAVEYQ